MKRGVMTKLTAKQGAFCYEYVKDRNATRAYIAAGYSPISAHTNASKLLQNTTISSRIAELTAERIMDIDEAFASMSQIARTSITSFLSVDEKNNRLYIDPQKVLDPDNAGAVKEFTREEKKGPRGGIVVTYTLKLFDKLSALNHVLQLYARLQKAMDSDEALKESIVQSLRDGLLDPQEVKNELPSIADELFAQAGIISTV